MKRFTFLLLASACFLSCQTLKTLAAVHVRVSYDLHNENFMDTPISSADVRVFFKSDSLLNVAVEGMEAAAKGTMELALAGIQAGLWDAEKNPIPTLYDSVATLTAVSELKAHHDSLAALGEVEENSFEEIYFLGKKSKYNSHPGEMIEELRSQAGQLGATAIIVTAVNIGSVDCLAIHIADHSSTKESSIMPQPTNAEILAEVRDGFVAVQDGLRAIRDGQREQIEILTAMRENELRRSIGLASA